MRLDETAESLYVAMEVELGELNLKRDNMLFASKQTGIIALQYLLKLKTYLNTYTFENATEEINFFKNIKPKFLSKSIYAQLLFQNQSNLPVGTDLEIKNYYRNTLKKINNYFDDNKEFFLYYRSGGTLLDQIYFTRKEADTWTQLNLNTFEKDLSFTTIFDYKLSKLIAYELLVEFIKKAVFRLETHTNNDVEKIGDIKPGIEWTASKASLIELVYALQSAGSFNNGTVDLKNLAGHFEHFFDIDLGNYYRVFQEIRIRKINRTNFLDKLKDRLIQRMDETDMNPRFK